MASKRFNLNFERRWIRSVTQICIVTSLAISLVACKTQQKPEEKGGTGTAEAERQRRADRIRSYFQDHSKQRSVVTTTHTKSGQTIDWIRPESQIPEGQKLAVAPTATGSVRTPAGNKTKIDVYTKPPSLNDRVAKTEVQLDPEARGPAGTVPVVRFDVENYLKTVQDLPENPADVFKK